MSHPAVLARHLELDQRTPCEPHNDQRHWQNNKIQRPTLMGIDRLRELANVAGAATVWDGAFVVGTRVRKNIAILAACSVLVATAASGQFVENGGQAGSADTSAFGQASEFSNVTTQFDGVELQLQRLIRDPKDKSRLKMIGRLVNTGTEDRWIFLFFPPPKLIDELGNEYAAESWTGVDACRDASKRDGGWFDELGGCQAGDFPMVLLSPGLPNTVMISFGPSEAGNYDQDLATLATYLDASLSFAVSGQDVMNMQWDDAEAALSSHRVIVPQIPMPAP